MVWETACLTTKKNLKIVFAATLVASSILAVGCASQPTVKNSRVFYVPEFYTVQSGDSLSKIAAKYGLNYMDIARLNHIEAIDKIHVNQSLRLRSSDKSAQRLVATARTAPLEQSAAIKQQSMALPITANTATVVAKPNTSTTSTVVPTVIHPTMNSQLKWVVPSQGMVIAKFAPEQNRKGVFFGGKVGDPVYAATTGEVVYADDGLKEYGKLILLRHSNGYVTAYAHNQQLLVKVGDKVNTGQKIAEMGSTGASGPMLQFQIRQDGKPIDPLTVLPIN